VAFDDGTETRRNLAWMNYTESRWEYAEPDTIKVEIGDWLIVITGYNLAPLFVALEEKTLVRVRAHPELKLDREREGDTFATAILDFLKAAGSNRTAQKQIWAEPGANPSISYREPSRPSSALGEPMSASYFA
jgi:hypothetical protein